MNGRRRSGSAVALRRAAAPPVRGLVESIRHSNEATPEPPASLPEKAKLAEPPLLSAGGLESIVVFGAAVSIVQLKEAGVWSALPAVSIARTSKEWAPSASAA